MQVAAVELTQFHTLLVLLGHIHANEKQPQSRLRILKRQPTGSTQHVLNHTRQLSEAITRTLSSNKRVFFTLVISSQDYACGRSILITVLTFITTIVAFTFFRHWHLCLWASL